MSIINQKSIGWDIGIKNLAFCILQPCENSSTETITINNHYYNICKWQDISLVDEIENALNSSGEASILNMDLKCCQPKTDKIGEKDLCNMKSCYVLDTKKQDGNYQGICKKHFKKGGYSYLAEINCKSCYYKDELGNKCIARPNQVLRDHVYKAYCKKHIIEMIKNKIKKNEDFFKINKAKKTATINLNHLGIALYKELDKNKLDLLEPVNVLFENQPVLKNPTMKSMQMFLYSYYLLRGMDDNARTLLEKHIQCYCASKKLDLIKFLPIEEQNRIQGIVSNVKTGYQQNKQMSIHLVEYLLRCNTKWYSFFNDHKKKDDLADSLLMTLHYLEKNSLVKINKQVAKDKKKKGKGKVVVEVDEDVDE
jgi:hypothetical protein